MHLPFEGLAVDVGGCDGGQGHTRAPAENIGRVSAPNGLKTPQAAAITALKTPWAVAVNAVKNP